MYLMIVESPIIGPSALWTTPHSDIFWHEEYFGLLFETKQML